MNITKLNAMSIEDLMSLNRTVVEVIKSKQKLANRAASFDFRPGDAVSYNSGKFGVRMTGEVVEMKRTKAVVKTSAGRFLVPASMLRKG